MTTPVTPIRSLGLSAALTLLTASPAAAKPILGLSEGQFVALAMSVGLVVFIAIGIYSIYSGIKSRGIAKASETWPTTGGTVLASEVVERKSYNRKQRMTTYYYEPLIRYSYKIAGTDYESSVIRFGDLVRNSRSLADELVTKYPQGSTVAVRYDPSDPARATLETASAGGRQFLTGIVFITVPIFIAVIASILWSGHDLPPQMIEQPNQTQQP